ncbi:MAG: hypothetical protein AMS26_05670 [Bacteroides sp. SM23_62]|nr:MAG: hypothetical protein AMS26_05670 [Bacteroides sp. SM23_62]
MFKIHILSAVRKLLKDRFYSLINVSGLAIGLASCLLIILYIQDELSYDKFHQKSGHFTPLRITQWDWLSGYKVICVKSSFYYYIYSYKEY